MPESIPKMESSRLRIMVGAWRVCSIVDNLEDKCRAREFQNGKPADGDDFTEEGPLEEMKVKGCGHTKLGGAPKGPDLDA